MIAGLRGPRDPGDTGYFYQQRIGDMSRDKVDTVYIICVLLCVAFISWVAHVTTRGSIINDCIRMNKFSDNERVFHCYPDGEED